MTLDVKYDSTCVRGFDFVFKNKTKFITGLTGTNTASIDLTTKQLYEVNYYCGLFCDRIQFCHLDLSKGIKSCTDTGNVAKSLTQTRKLTNYCVSGFFGDYILVGPFNCVKDFGVIYFEN